MLMLTSPGFFFKEANLSDAMFEASSLCVQYVNERAVHVK